MRRFLKHTQTLREKKQAVMQFMMRTTFRIGLSVFIAFMGVLYVVQTTSVSTKGFDISELEQQVVQLERETKRLDVQIAEHRSLQSVRTRMEGERFVPVDHATYVRANDVFARR